ncbi:glucose-6-phosphatase 2-like [Physella acuta]|uniref:glucose-6-phosphatase 2-like n=1 Tax=Physella acuta TaxID=109671 RepID=UPI0027DC4951|nr:glucose-6-phosphatase 2-like [Physella acuta]
MIYSLHLWGISVIQNLQIWFKGYDGMMLLLSNLGDPRFAFTLYFPVAYFLHSTVGKRVLWVAAVSEWLNAIAKWLFHGERPYWWIHESGAYSKEKMPYLRQYNITCETGPGSPSGHAMITSAVWYILISDFLYYKQVQSILAKSLFWIGYLLFMCSVCVSRLFVATHFPHQVLAGVFVGILLGKILNSISISSLVWHHYVLASLVLSAVAAATYILVLALGVDPMWSVQVALKWCAFREWVHQDTTLFYSIIRDVSSLIGLGIAVTLLGPKQEKSESIFRVVAQIIISLLLVLVTDRLKPSQDNMLLFYVLAFFKHSFTIVLLTVGVPTIFGLCSKKKD